MKGMKIDLKSAIILAISLVTLLMEGFGAYSEYASAQDMTQKEIRVNLATRWLVLIEEGQWVAKYKFAGIGDPASIPTLQGSFSSPLAYLLSSLQDNQKILAALKF